MSDWKYRQGDETIIRTAAWSPPGCHPTGCGIKLHVKDGKLVYVEGDDHNHVSRGALCPRCLTLKEYIYHPDRLLHPMKRARADRGKDKWERISWDEAFDTIAEHAKACRAQYGPQSIAVFVGTGREGSFYENELAFTALGSSNSCYTQSGNACYYPRATATTYIMGGGYPELDYAGQFRDRYDDPRWVAPKYILVWGKQPLASNPDGLWGHALIDLVKDHGTKLICIDPCITWLNSRAEFTIQLRPGTDGALALAMLNIIINEDLYDHDFVDCWTYGFEALSERVQQYPPEWAAEVCDVPVEQVYEVARLYATNHPSCILWGLAIDQNVNGVQAGQALLSLMAITGNIDAPGGNILGEPDPDNNRAYDIAGWAIREGMITQEDYDNRIGVRRYPSVQLLDYAHPDCMLEALEESPCPIHMVYIQSSNMVYGAGTAAPSRWLSALRDNVDFIVASELFQNATTMAVADLVLPLSTFAEHDGIVIPQYGQSSTFRHAINKAITVGECKSDVEIMLEIGKRMFPDYWNQFEDAQDYFTKKEIIAPYKSFEEFQDADYVLDNQHYRKYADGRLRPDGQVGFMTQTGRVELYSYMYERYGDDPLPYYVEPPFSPNSTPELAEEYPLILTSGRRTFVSFHSEHRAIPTLREIVPFPVVDIHPDTAAKYGIEEGDWVWIENEFGRCKEKAHLTLANREDVIHAMHGWWYPEQDGEAPHLFGGATANVNQCMPNHVIGKAGWGNTFKNQMCRIYKADGGEPAITYEKGRVVTA